MAVGHVGATSIGVCWWHMLTEQEGAGGRTHKPIGQPGIIGADKRAKARNSPACDGK